MTPELSKQIQAEQDYGRKKYAGSATNFAKDDANSPNDWARWIGNFNSRALGSPLARRHCLLRIAGLAVAAIEAIDRATEKAPPFFDPESVAAPAPQVPAPQAPAPQAPAPQAPAPTAPAAEPFPSPCTDRVRHAILLAKQSAIGRGWPAVQPEHLLVGLLREGSGIATTVLRNNGLDSTVLLKALSYPAYKLESPPMNTTLLPMSVAVDNILETADTIARNFGHHYIGTEHVLLALLAEENTASTILEGLGIKADAVRADIFHLLGMGPSVPRSLPVALIQKVEELMTYANAGYQDRDRDAVVAAEHRGYTKALAEALSILKLIPAAE